MSFVHACNVILFTYFSSNERGSGRMKGNGEKLVWRNIYVFLYIHLSFLIRILILCGF